MKKVLTTMLLTVIHFAVAGNLPGPRPANVQFNFGANANPNAVSDLSRNILNNLGRDSGNNTITITSTTRTPIALVCNGGGRVGHL